MTIGTTDLLRESAETLRAGIIEGHDWPNTQPELDRINGAMWLKRAADEIDHLRGKEYEASDSLTKLLPGPYYMDPPDGGSVTVLEQLQRMSKDAERYRWLRSEHGRDDPICHLSWKLNGDRNSSEWVNTANLDDAIDRQTSDAVTHNAPMNGAFAVDYRRLVRDDFECRMRSEGYTGTAISRLDSGEYVSPHVQTKWEAEKFKYSVVGTFAQNVESAMRESVVLSCIDIVAMYGGSIEIEAAIRRLIDTATVPR